MRVFGFVGVLAVEKHPSGDYEPLADNRIRKCRCTPIHAAFSRRARFRLNRSPSRSNFYDNVTSLIRRFLRIHCDINVGVTIFHLLRPTVAAFDAARFYTNDKADYYRPAIGTESIPVIAGSQHIAQRNVSVDVLLSGCHVPVLLAVQRLNPGDLCSSGHSTAVMDVLCASKGDGCYTNSEKHDE